MEEQRSFMRIPTRLHGHLRMLDDPEEVQIFRETPLMGSNSCLGDGRDPGISEALYAMLCTINTKLDMLLSMHSRDAIGADFPLALDVVEIGGAGVRFRCDTELSVDQAVEVVLVLSRFPLRMAGAMGRITARTDQAGHSLYALDFTRIRERDLENIVQFVFQSQRDELRGKKWG